MALNYSKGTISYMGEVTGGKSKNGFDWSRQTIMLDIQGNQGTITKVVFQASNERVEDLKGYKVGDKVEIGWSIYAREWNGKWYNNVDLVNIKTQGVKVDAPQTKNIPASELEPKEGDLPW